MNLHGLPKKRSAAFDFRKHESWSIPHVLRFCAVGLFATVVHYTAALIGLSWFGLAPVTANASGFVSALAFSFFGHARVTFSVQATRIAALKFLVVNVTTIGLGSLLVASLHRHTSLGGAEVLAAGAMFSAGSNFAGHSLWTFNRARSKGR